MKKYEFKCKDGTVKQYDFISKFYNGFAAVEQNGKWGYIDEEGNEICELKYEFPRFNNHKSPFRFSEGYVGVGIPKGRFLRFGYIDEKGKEVCPFEYTAVCDFRNGLALVRDEKFKWSVINKKFETVTKRKYDYICNFYMGLAVVKLDGLFGFINESCEEMCELKYNYMSAFSHLGYAQIDFEGSDSDKLYWIDKQGKVYYTYYDTNEMYPLNE